MHRKLLYIQHAALHLRAYYYIEVIWLGKRAGSFDEMKLELVLHVENLYRQTGQLLC